MREYPQNYAIAMMLFLLFFGVMHKYIGSSENIGSARQKTVNQ
jgi:hypothetical protein